MDVDLSTTFTLPCPSWILACGSNTHIAKDDYWFCADYRRISSTVENQGVKGDSEAVVGIGTAIIPVKTKPDSGMYGNSILTLRDVIHVPSHLCNIIGGPALEHYEFDLFAGPGYRGTIKLSDGTPVGFFAPHNNLFEVQLSDFPVGPLVGSSPFVVSAA